MHETLKAIEVKRKRNTKEKMKLDTSKYFRRREKKERPTEITE